MNNLLSQKWCLCFNVQNRIKLCRAKNHKFGDETTVCLFLNMFFYTHIYALIPVHSMVTISVASET